MMMLPEFIPEELEAPQLDLLGRQLSKEVARLGKLVAQYESDYTAKTKAYKLELAKAKILYKDAKYNATMINAMAETSEAVQKAANELQQAEAILIIGKAELDGRESQYQMVKKIIDLKIQELRTFRG
jgi:hypothetical protein